MLNPTVFFRRAPARLSLLLVLALGCLSAARAQTYSQIIVFGDSLSDTGNDAAVSEDDFGVRVPGYALGGAVNYTDGRFTSGTDTDPASVTHAGVWHEQLAKLFLGLPAAKPSLDGGLDYAFGGATTESGTRKLDFTDQLGITVDNMGKQVTDYLAQHPVDPAALYIVWGGANDIFVSSTNNLANTAKQAARREGQLITKLAQAGAVHFLVPNLPRIGNTPRYNGNGTQIDAYNTACEIFGTKLSKKITGVTAALAAEGITVDIHLLDVYNLFSRLLINQEAFGLYNIVDSSQGESAKPDRYLFWDDVHPTTSGHYQLALEAYTVLTGRPLVQVQPSFNADGFWLTRSGTNDAERLKVPYTLGGTAVAGTDYAPLTGRKNIKVDKFAAKVMAPALNAAAAKGKTVLLDIADGGEAFGVGTVNEAKIEYGNPVVKNSEINAPPARRAFVQPIRLMLPQEDR